MTHYERKILLPFSASTVFEWHKQDGALERLIPPWQQVKILKREGQGIQNGARLKMKVSQGWLGGILEVEHRDYIEGKQFRDVLIQGPYKRWEHTHLTQDQQENESLMIDSIEYETPFSYFIQSYMEKELNRLFTYRHQTLKEDLFRHQGVKSMKILISGASGLVGSALVPFLTTGQHQVVKLVRQSTNLKSDEIAWDPATGFIDGASLEGFDAVVHLAGESIMGRWTEEKKQKIKESRVKGTQLLSQTLSQLKQKPSVFICSSATGYYGNRGDEILTEQSPKGEGFLADVCEEWENATRTAVEASIRTINLRTGIVLSPKGGALKQMLTPFKWGLGGEMGSGQQYMSWITLDDLIYMILYLIEQPFIAGPVNAVGPHPVTNKEFIQTLGHVLHRPTFLKVPTFGIQLLFGEMGEELLLTSARVEPAKLNKAGFRFSYPHLEKALSHLLGH